VFDLHVSRGPNALSHDKVPTSIVVPSDVEVTICIVLEVNIGEVVRPVLYRVVANAILACLKTWVSRCGYCDVRESEESTCDSRERMHGERRTAMKLGDAILL
jgi:hypothetical protein